MAVITTYVPPDISYNKSARPDFSDNLNSIDFTDLSPPITLFEKGESFYAVVTNNEPISELEDVIVSYKSRSFKDDYYYRIHLLPTSINLGNLLSGQTREVEVWNAYFEPHLLNSITPANATGLTLIEPDVPPTYFQSLESRIYNLTISATGSPVISASYTFDFDTEDPVLLVTGRRVVVWPFIPQTKHKESLEWKTDVIPSIENEQRIALRPEPRQSFSYEFQLSESQFSRAKAIAHQWSHRVYGIPVWAELTFVGALEIGITQVPVDTQYQDYRENDIILIWEDDINFVAVETLSVDPAYVELKLPLEVEFTNAYVCPLRYARTMQGMNFKRDSIDYAISNSTFLVTQNVDHTNTIGLPVYRTKDVLNIRTILTSPVNERIRRAVTIFDNGSGPIEIEEENDWVDVMWSMTFDTLTRQERWQIREWIHSRKGKQKGFWLPSWNQDINILTDVSNTASSLEIIPIGYPLYYTVTDLMIILNDGTEIFTRVTGGSTNVDGNEVLALDDQIGTSFLTTDVALACFMKHVELPGL